MRDEVSNSVHIKKLVSDDGNFIVRLIMAYVDESVTRPAKKCSDARFKDFEKAFDRFITRGFCLLRKWIKKDKKDEQVCVDLDMLVPRGRNAY